MAEMAAMGQVETHDALVGVEQCGVDLRDDRAGGLIGRFEKVVLRPPHARGDDLPHTWKLAGEPESDCTLTPHLAGSSLNAARARF